jgi:hypothetical protein
MKPSRLDTTCSVTVDFVALELPRDIVRRSIAIGTRARANDLLHVAVARV